MSLLWTVMNVQLIREKIFNYMYPSQIQLQEWKKKHKRKIQNRIGWFGSIEPLCYLCRIRQEKREKRERTLIQENNIRLDNMIYFLKFHKHIRRLRAYVSKYHPESCIHNSKRDASGK